MTDLVQIAETVEQEKPFRLNVAEFVATRGLIEGNSGSGKSYAARVIVEQCFGKVQIIVIDPEGEYATLREKFPFVLAASPKLVEEEKAETVADPRTADILAERVLKNQLSIICDISELKADAQRVFVKNFLEVLHEVPSEERTHLIMVMIDEADYFAPEGSQSLALAAMQNLCKAGRKRGHGAVLITQRISELEKLCASQMDNVLIGKTWLNNDVNRVGEILGLIGTKERMVVKELVKGEFFAFGPGFEIPGVNRIKVGKAQTTHPSVSTAIGLRTPPTPKAVKFLLPQLSDIPVEKEKKVKTEQDLRHDLQVVHGELAAAKRKLETQTMDPTKVQAIVDDAYKKGANSVIGELTKLQRSFDNYILTTRANRDKLLTNLNALAESAAKWLGDGTTYETPKLPDPPKQLPQMRMTSYPLATPLAAKPVQKSNSLDPSLADGGVHLKDGAWKMLQRLEQLKHLGSLNKPTLSVLTGYSTNSSTWGEYTGAIVRAGYAKKNGEDFSITDEGSAAVQAKGLDPLPTDRDSILRWWKEKFKLGAQKMLDVIIAHPEGISDEDLSAESGYSLTSSTFGEYTGVLRRANLIVKGEDKLWKPTSYLFGEM